MTDINNITDDELDSAFDDVVGDTNQNDDIDSDYDFSDDVEPETDDFDDIEDDDPFEEIDPTEDPEINPLLKCR